MGCDKSVPISQPVYVEPTPTGDEGQDLLNQIKATRDYDKNLREWKDRLANGGYIFVPYIITSTPVIFGSCSGIEPLPSSMYQRRLTLHKNRDTPRHKFGHDIGYGDVSEATADTEHEHIQ